MLYDRNYAWIKSFLSNRSQFVQVDENCRAGSSGIARLHFGPLLFLSYVSDLKNSSVVLDRIMLADDTNLFYTDKVIFNGE